MTEPMTGPTSSAPNPSPQPAAPAPAAAASPAPPDNAAPPAAPAPSPAPAKAEMPAGLDASFWDAEKGAIKFDDLNKELAALRTAKAEWDNAKSVVPEAPDKYEFKLPEGFQTPDGLQLNQDDPRLPLVRKLAHEAGLSQKQFEALIRMDAEAKAAEVSEFNARVKQEQEKLGPDGGKARVDAVTRGLVATVGEDMAKHLIPLMVGATQVRAMEIMLGKLAGQGTATGGYQPGSAQATAKISEEEWSKLTPLQRINYAREQQQQRRSA